MKRSILMLFVGVLLSSLLSTTEINAAPRENTLKIYNWAGYIDMSLLDEFVVWYKEQTGEDLSIVYQTYDLNEVALAKVERAKADYDLICPSEYIVERMFNSGLLLPLDKDFGSTPNYLDNISPYIKSYYSEFSSADRDIDDYAVPHFWNVTGLLYNRRTVPLEEVQSWGVLWDRKYKNRVLMKDDVRQLYGITRAYLHQDEIKAGSPIGEVLNYNSEEAIAEVEAELLLARDNIAGFEMDFGKEMMTKEKVDISVQYSGDAYWACNEASAVGVDLDFIVPLEGSSMFIDLWVIPKYAENVKAASYFINFMCRPDNAIRNMDVVGYSSAIATPEILEYVTDDTLEDYIDLSYFFGEGAERVKVNPLLYPESDVVGRCSIMRDFGDLTERMTIMWATVKGDNLSVGIVILILVTLALFVAYYIRKQYKQNQRRRYRRQGR